MITIERIEWKINYCICYSYCILLQILDHVFLKIDILIHDVLQLHSKYHQTYITQLNDGYIVVENQPRLSISYD